MKSLQIFFALLVSAYTLNADPYTDYILKAGLGINGNIYSSDFTQIGTFKNCCPKYESAFGLSPQLYVGGEVRNIFNLFGYDMSYSLQIGYNDLSAAYHIKQHIGNLIEADSYEKIIVEHNLDLSYQTIYNEHALWFNPVNSFPLGIKLGLNFGIPLTKDFDQKEILLKPSNATFPDGTTEFNPGKGVLPNASPIILAVSIGARYNIMKLGDYDLFASAAFNYGINSITSDNNWNIHQANLGVSIHYNIPKPEPPRPVVPPVPDAPEPISPPIAMKPEIIIDTEFDYKPAKSGDTLKVLINKYEYNNYATINPIIFFKKNSTIIIKSDDIYSASSNISSGVLNISSDNLNISDKVEISENYASLVSNHIKNHPGSRVNIISESEDEDKSVINDRAELITQQLIKSGVEKSLISAELRQIKARKDENPLLSEESRRVFFEFINAPELIGATIDTDYMTENFNKVMNVIPKFRAEQPYTFSGRTIYNNGNKVALKEGVNQVVLSSSMFINDGKPNKFEIEAEVTDTDSNTAKDNSVFYLTSNEKIVRSFINLNRKDDGEVEEFIIGYMPFDKTDFNLINDFIIDYIRSKASEGRTLEIIPLTDDIGTPEYNLALAEKRANSAIKLIGTNFKNYELKIPQKSLFRNDTPYGRMMNRSVIVRIK